MPDVDAARLGADPSGDCDVAVVGGGILGLATARELQRRGAGRIVVLEREEGLARHQTGASSGVAHAGIYYAPGSLKARLCVAGRAALEAFCAEHGVAYEACGKVVVALAPDELPRLDELERRGRANGVPGLRRLGPEEVRALEPHVTTAVAGLHSPRTAIVDFPGVAAVLAAQLEAEGGLVATGCAVTALHGPGAPGAAARRRTVVVHARGATHARHVVVCAGASADRLAVGAGAPADPRIVPFRGAYLRLVPERRHLCRGLIYPVPDPDLPFLGVHLTRTVGGEVLLGPTALLVGARDAYDVRRVRRADLGATMRWPGTWRMARRFWRTGLAELRVAVDRRALVAACARYVPELRARDVIAGPAGVRAQALGRDGSLVDDFVLSATPGALHVRNAPSPAATSSLALAALIADRALSDL